MLRTLAPALLLLAVAAACPRPSGPVRGDGGEAAPPVPPPASATARHLPPGLEAWLLAGRTETYGPADLEDLLNGGAERYRRAGYREAAVAEYRKAALPTASLRVELYDMGSPLGAFGLLASDLAELADPSEAESPGVPELREAGVIGPGALSFHRGDLLVRLILQDASAEATEASLETLSRDELPGVARLLARRLPGSSEAPPELAALPASGKVRRSEQHHPDHLLGLDGLGPGLSALYGEVGPRYRLGVSLGLDEAGARAGLAAFSRRAAALPLEGLGDEAASGHLDGRVAVAGRRGDRLVVVVAAPGAAPAASGLRQAAAAALDPGLPAPP